MSNGKYDKNKRWREKNKQRGLCPRCGKKSETDRFHCNSCSEKLKAVNRKSQRKLYKECREQSKCASCGVQVRSSSLWCPKCRAERNEYQRTRYLIRKLVKQGRVAAGIPDEIPVVFNCHFPETEIYIDKFVSGSEGVEFSPVDHKPGSEDKVSALSYRYDNGLPLFHSNDKRHGA